MKSNSRFASKLVPLAIGLIALTVIVVFAVQALTKATEIPFSAIERTIQAQNGEMVTLKEMSDGTIYIETPKQKYVSHFRPNSPLVEELVEKY
ncbi:MAG TPA: ATP-binding protein, partial [Bacillaceae bacterium]